MGVGHDLIPCLKLLDRDGFVLVLPRDPSDRRSPVFKALDHQDRNYKQVSGGTRQSDRSHDPLREFPCFPYVRCSDRPDKAPQSRVSSVLTMDRNGIERVERLPGQTWRDR